MTMDEFEKKLAELEDLHNELKTQIAELKARGEEKPKPPEPPHPRWIPKDNEIYYTIMYSCGIIDILNWSDTKPSHERFKLGNVYKTRAEAEFAAERMRVLAEMREWAGNWDDPYVLYYGFEHGKVFAYPTTNVDGALKFRTEEDASNCIKAVGEDRIKKYYFMIPEETNND